MTIPDIENASGLRIHSPQYPESQKRKTQCPAQYQTGSEPMTNFYLGIFPCEMPGKIPQPGSYSVIDHFRTLHIQAGFFVSRNKAIPPAMMIPHKNNSSRNADPSAPYMCVPTMT